MENLIKEHEEKFGIKPFIIGMFWNNENQPMKNIIEAIEDNIPYDEYEMLSEDEQKAYHEGSLVF